MRHRNNGYQLAAASLLLAMTAASAPAGSATPSPGVFGPDARPFGATYGEWSSFWWNWAVSERAANSPVVHAATPDECKVGQIGPVWFLAGPSNANEQRFCRVTSDKAILFPVINAEQSASEGDCQLPGTPPGSSPRALRACAVALMGLVTELQASIDGVQVQGLPRFRFESPLFRLTGVAGNFTNSVQPGTFNAVADGFFVMVKPLSPGQHIIHFRGAAASLGFHTEATYHITVVP